MEIGEPKMEQSLRVTMEAMIDVNRRCGEWNLRLCLVSGK